MEMGFKDDLVLPHSLRLATAKWGVPSKPGKKSGEGKRATTAVVTPPRGDGRHARRQSISPPRNAISRNGRGGDDFNQGTALHSSLLSACAPKLQRSQQEHVEEGPPTSKTDHVIDFDALYNDQQSEASSQNINNAEKSTLQDDPPENDTLDKQPGIALVELGKAQANLGDLDQALATWEEALRVQRRDVGDEHIAVARTLVARGKSLAAVGRLYDSVLDLEKAARIQQRVAEEDKSSFQATNLEAANTLILVGAVQHERANFVESFKCFHDALDIRRGVLGPKHVDVARLLCIIGRAHHKRRQYSEAIAAYTDGLSVFRAVGVTKQSPDVAWVLRCISDKNMFADRVANFWEDPNSI